MFSTYIRHHLKLADVKGMVTSEHPDRLHLKVYEEHPIEEFKLMNPDWVHIEYDGDIIKFFKLEGFDVVPTYCKELEVLNMSNLGLYSIEKDNRDIYGSWEVKNHSICLDKLKQIRYHVYSLHTNLRLVSLVRQYLLDMNLTSFNYKQVKVIINKYRLDKLLIRDYSGNLLIISVEI